MDAKEFFSAVVVENYKEAIADPANLRKLWNAAVSMNTVAEYLALHRAGYPTLIALRSMKKQRPFATNIPTLKRSSRTLIDLNTYESMKHNR